MWKTIRTLLIIVVVLGAVTLFIFRDRIEFGSLFAGVATFFAALRSKIFGASKVEKLISGLEDEHTAKQVEWTAVREKFDARIEALRARMEYHDYRSALISGMITDLDDTEKRAMDNLKNMTDEEILERVRGE